MRWREGAGEMRTAVITGFAEIPQLSLQGLSRQPIAKHTPHPRNATMGSPNKSGDDKMLR